MTHDDFVWWYNPYNHNDINGLGFGGRSRNPTTKERKSFILLWCWEGASKKKRKKEKKVFVFNNHSFQKHLPKFRVKRVNCNYLEQEQHDVYKKCRYILLETRQTFPITWRAFQMGRRIFCSIPFEFITIYCLWIQFCRHKHKWLLKILKTLANTK